MGNSLNILLDNARPRAALFCCLLFMLAAGCSNTTPPVGNAPVSFVVIGDTPYAGEDIAMLDKAVAAIKASPPPFVIHVGDYKGGRAACIAEHDIRHKELFDRLEPIPMFYTPGDNEWTDCDRNVDETTGELYSDLDRLARVRALFFTAPVLTPVDWTYQRQDAQVENATWRYENIRFATLHVVGTNNGRDWVTGDPLEDALVAVTARDEANSDWLNHVAELAIAEGAGAMIIALQADMTDVKAENRGKMCADVAANDKHPCDAFEDLRDQIAAITEAFGKPVLVIHGDTAPFALTQDFAGNETPLLWRLNAAGDAGPTYGKRDVTLVGVNLESETPFSAQGYLTGDRPSSR